MPAKRKTTSETQDALRRLFAAREAWENLERLDWPPTGMRQTSEYVTNSKGETLYRNPTRVWILRRRVRVKDTTEMRDADPLVTALWDTLPEGERRRSRLFVCCVDCPVRFTKKGAIADVLRHKRPPGRYSPPSRKERVSAEVRASIEPPKLDPRDDEEKAIAEVWAQLSEAHRRTLFAWMRPAVWHREWALEGAPSPEAFTSRVRTARRALARALAPSFFPDTDYTVKTRGRRGFDYDRFWKDWDDYWLDWS